MNKTEIKKYIINICNTSYNASRIARSLSNSQRTKIITTMIKNLRKDSKIIIQKKFIRY